MSSHSMYIFHKIYFYIILSKKNSFKFALHKIYYLLCVKVTQLQIIIIIKLNLAIMPHLLDAQPKI